MTSSTEAAHAREEYVRVAVRILPQQPEDQSALTVVQDTHVKVSAAAESAYAAARTPKTGPAGAVGTPSRIARTPVGRPASSRTPLRPWQASGVTAAARTPMTPRLPSDRIFAVDRVLTYRDSQEDVFDELVAPLVQDTMAGRNATVFAYGQTGSGKTYTMFGPANNVGVLPRVIKAMFQHVDQHPSRMYVIRASFVELYNDVFRDLLAPDNDPTRAKRFDVATKQRVRLQLHQDSNNQIYLTGSETLRQAVTSPEHMMKLLACGTRARTIGSTRANDRSSRGHTIVTLHVESREQNSPDAPVLVSKVHLIDLAGSESLRSSGAQGDSLQETRRINASLTALGDVFSALARAGTDDKARELVPYRNSKLTRFLQDSLGGNCRTLMLAHVQAGVACVRESIKTLDYACKVKMIRNTVSVNTDTDGHSQLSDLQVEIERLNSRLADQTSQISEYQRRMTAQQSRSADGQQSKEENAAAAKQLAELQGQISCLEQTVEQERAGFEAKLVGVIHAHGGALAEQRYQYAVLNEAVEQQKHAMHQLELQLALREDALAELEAERATLQSTVSDLTQKLAREQHVRDQRIAAVEAARARSERECANARSEVERLQKQVQRSGASSANAENELIRVKDELERMRADQNSRELLQVQLETLQRDMAKAQEDKMIMARRLAELEARRRESRIHRASVVLTESEAGSPGKKKKSKATSKKSKAGATLPRRRRTSSVVIGDVEVQVAAQPSHGAGRRVSDMLPPLDADEDDDDGDAASAEQVPSPAHTPLPPRIATRSFAAAVASPLPPSPPVRSPARAAETPVRRGSSGLMRETQPATPGLLHALTPAKSGVAFATAIASPHLAVVTAKTTAKTAAAAGGAAERPKRRKLFNPNKLAVPMAAGRSDLYGVLGGGGFAPPKLKSAGKENA